MKCCVCEKSDRGLFRVNEKGVKAVWACSYHIKHFPDARPDDELLSVINSLREIK